MTVDPTPESAPRSPIVLSFDHDTAWAGRHDTVDASFPPRRDLPSARDGFELAMDFLDTLFRVEPLHNYQAPATSVSDSYLMQAHGLTHRMCPELSTALLAAPASVRIAPFLRENAEGFLAQVPDGILTPSAGPMLTYGIPGIGVIEGKDGPDLAILGERSIVRETNEGPLIVQRFPDTFISVSLSAGHWTVSDFQLGKGTTSVQNPFPSGLAG